MCLHVACRFRVDILLHRVSMNSGDAVRMKLTDNEDIDD